jgi:hypothetical protein
MSAQSVRVITDLSVDYKIKGTEDTIVFNDSTNLAASFELGRANGDGRQFMLKNIGTCTVTLTPETGEVIFSTSEELTKILYTGESAIITDYAAEKWIFASYEFEITPLAEGGTGIEVSGVNHIFYVDGARTDTYTADGSILRPYTTILAAQNAVNALSVNLLDSAAHFELCKFIINIAPGKYTDNVAVSTVRYLRWNMEGVEVSGNVTITQNQLGITDYYGKVEFVGGMGNRPYRGNCGLFSGTITFLKDAFNSLAYDAFVGCNITGNLQYGTSTADTHGTWVLCLYNSYFGDGTKFISAYLTDATEHVMIEGYGYNKILSHIAKQDGSATKVTIYDCNNTYFDLINSTPLESGVVKNCTFNSTTSIVAVKTLSIDNNSYKSLRAVTPTLTGMTITLLDDYLPNPNCVYYIDGNRTDIYTANGSAARPFLTIDAALTVIAADVAVHVAANTYDQANYVIDVAQGTYDEALAIGNVKNLRFNLHGATISGNITYTTTMVGGSADYYYSRLEFCGAIGNRPEKGTAGRITGTITGTRNNDSLCYVAFSGIDLKGNIAFNTNGTWVVAMHNCFFGAILSAGNSALVLLETTGHNIFSDNVTPGKIAAAADGTSVTAVSLYNCDNTEFALINISNAAGSRITNCSFKTGAAVTVTGGTLSIDSNSYRSLMTQTPTLTGATIKQLDEIPANTRVWDTVVTLQSVIDSITDMSATKPYTIIVPPGSYTIGTIALKPWVNLKGFGGRGRMTIFKNGALNLLDASIPASGVHRFRMDGIRLETCPVTFVCTTNGKTLLPVMDDCPCNSNSPIVSTGEAYGAATTMINLELRNMNIDKNTSAQMFTYTRLSAWNCSLLGLYFTSSDAYFFGCDISSACNVVNAGADGGWFEFNGCKIDTMALNDPTSESTLATLCGGGNENVQVFGTIHGATAPSSLTNWDRFQPSTLYFCHSDSKLYVKTGEVGTNTWTSQT